MTPRKHRRLSRRASWCACVLLLAFAVCSAGCRRDNSSSQTQDVAKPTTYQIQGTVFKPDAADHSGILVLCVGTPYMASTDEKGQYVIAGIPAGNYKIQCQHPDYLATPVDSVSLADGVADPSKPVLLGDVTLSPRMTPAQEAERILCSVMGQVLLDGRATAEGVVVRAVNTDFRTVTSPDGSYQLLRLDPGQYTLMFEKDGYRSQRLSVRLESGELVFQDPLVLEPMPPPVEGRLLSGSVSLLDSDGNALNDFSGVLVYLEGGEGTTRLTQPDQGGLFRFENLSPARYTVAAAGPAFLSRDRVEADLTSAMEASVVLTLQSLDGSTSAPGSLVGRVVKDDPQDPAAGTLVGLVEIGATAMTDPGGNYVFENVPPGTYTVIAQADGYFPAGLEEVVVTEDNVAEAVDIQLQKERDFPRVLATLPANGENNVMIRELVPLSIRFSKKMQPESLRQAFSISPDVAHVVYVGREHAMSGDDLLYVELVGYGEQQPLQFNRSYTVTISPAATDLEGLPLERLFRFSFRTGRASVIASRPADGADDVFADSMQFRPVVYFNARLDPRSVTADRIRIRPALGSTIQVDMIDNPSTGWSMVQIIGAPWQPGVRYTVTVSSGIRTLNNSPISNLPYSFRFETSRGRSIDFNPARSPGRR